MCRDEFNVRAKDALHLINNAALNAGNVGDERARAEKMLIGFDPFDENVGIERKNDKIGTFNKLGLNVYRTV